MTHYTLTGILSPFSVSAALQATTKTDAIAELVALLAKSGRVTDKDAVLSRLLAREAQSSTAIADGIALPHTKTGGVSCVCMAFGISRNGIDFGASDGKPTHLFALAASPDESASTYLATLVELIDKLRVDTIRKKLLACATDKELYERLLCYDHSMAAIATLADSAE